MRWVRRCDVWSVECSVGVGVGRCHGSLAVGHHTQSVHYIRGPADARRVGHLVRSQVDLLFIQGFKLQFRCILNRSPKLQMELDHVLRWGIQIHVSFVLYLA